METDRRLAQSIRKYRFERRTPEGGGYEVGYAARRNMRRILNLHRYVHMYILCIRDAVYYDSLEKINYDFINQND